MLEAIKNWKDLISFGDKLKLAPFQSIGEMRRQIAALPKERDVALVQCTRWLVEIANADEPAGQIKADLILALDEASQSVAADAHHQLVAHFKTGRFHQMLWSALFDYAKSLEHIYVFLQNDLRKNSNHYKNPGERLLSFMARAYLSLVKQSHLQKLRYQPPEKRLSTLMADWYRFAESKQVDHLHLSIYSSMPQKISLSALFSRAALSDSVGSGGLHPRQIELAQSIFDELSDAIRVELEPSNDSVLRVHLNESGRVERDTGAAGHHPLARYLSTDRLEDRLQEAQERVSGASLNAPSSQELALVMRHLRSRLLSVGPARRHERREASGKLRLVHQFNEIYKILNSVSRRGELIQEWSVVDISESGIGARMNLLEDWVQPGSLILFQTDNDPSGVLSEWRLGCVRRITKEGAAHLIGIEVLSTNPRAATIRLTGKPGKYPVLVLEPAMDGEQARILCSAEEAPFIPHVGMLYEAGGAPAKVNVDTKFYSSHEFSIGTFCFDLSQAEDSAP